MTRLLTRPLTRSGITHLCRMALLGALLSTVAACAQRNRAGEGLAQQSQAVQKFDSNLTFNNVTLEQANQQGQLWWRVKAQQAVYSKDQKNATVQKPKGELFQDGKLVFRIEAAKSEIQQDGQSISLKGQITAIDTRNGTVMKGNTLEWRPTEDVLLIRDRFTGRSEQMQVAAKEGRFLTRSRQLEMMGQIVAVLKQPEVKLQGEQLRWQIQQNKVTSDRPVQVERYQNQVLSDRGSADQADVDLQTKIINFRQNAKFALNQDNLQVAGNLLTWDMAQQQMRAPQPVTVVNVSQQVKLQADRGDLSMEKQVAHLQGNVRGEGGKNQSSLRANQVTWFLQNQQFQAEGNVSYQQANPPFSLSGPKAVGSLSDQQVAVDGGRVELQITPQGQGR